MPTEIAWADETWNVVTGCTRVSDGCLHCYIPRTPPFRMAHRRFDHDGIGATTGVKLHSDRLPIPLAWRKPRRIFVCSLADLFHDAVPDRYIAEVFAVMSIAERHTFQVLTKRPARMRSLLNTEQFWVLVDNARAVRRHGPLPGAGAVALPNVWIGTSVESQQWADIRIPALLETPAAIRWLSMEPLLGAVDLTNVAPGLRYANSGFTALAGSRRVDWVVVGGESGPGARPMHPDWARSLRDQCIAAGTPYLFKQWGEWAPNGQRGIGIGQHAEGREGLVGPADERGFREVIERVGKKAAGRELDGRTWDEYPPALATTPA